MEIRTKVFSVIIDDKEIEFKVVRDIPNTEKLLRDFLSVFSIRVLGQQLVVEQPEKKVMMARLPTIKQRQNMLMRDMNKEDFSIQDYQDFMYKLGYDVKDVMYHDVRRLVNDGRVEEILVDEKSTMPKKYKIIRKDEESELNRLTNSLKEGNKVLMGTFL